MRAFTFGEPEQVLSGNIGEYLGVFLSDDGEIYKPPVSLAGLSEVGVRTSASRPWLHAARAWRAGRYRIGSLAAISASVRSFRSLASPDGLLE